MWKCENVKMVELWNDGIVECKSIFSFHHTTILSLSHCFSTLHRGQERRSTECRAETPHREV